MVPYNLRQQLYNGIQSARASKLLTATNGNFSVCIPGKKEILITPTSLQYDLLTSEDIVRISFDGQVLEGSRSPSSEWRMHVAIYNNLGVMAVLHTHSPYATALSVARVNIPVILDEMSIWFNGEIGVADYTKPGTTEVGLSALPFLKSSHACLLANHGTLAAGADVQEALDLSLHLEAISEIFVISQKAGTPFIIR
ncbi:MAG: class II aldolase/adducin family protein [Bacteroidales bacterium]|jgi:L-ribulose-5-phosphate 4-epimerase|nr:class II aldolase/adducin family protein [Bacteroidales bacterium]